MQQSAEIQGSNVWGKEVATHCFYCGELFDGRIKTIDHFFPSSKSISEYDNRKAIVCSQCNQAKADIHPFELLNKAQTAQLVGLSFLIWQDKTLSNLVRSLSMIFRHVRKGLPPRLYLMYRKRRIYLDNYGVDKINKLK